MVGIILVGHGEKAKFYKEGEKAKRYNKKDDHKIPLAENAKQECQNLGAFLQRTGVGPDVVLTSGFQHSIDTGEQIAAEIRPRLPGSPPDLPRVVLVGLTPPPPPPGERQGKPDGTASLSIDAILEEAKAKVAGINIIDTSTLLFVGHHPRLPQLVTKMTGTLTPPLERLAAVCVEADTLTDLELGRGKVRWRHPVKPQGEELGDKLTGKMTVAALLAGFNFTALIELIKEPGGLMREDESRWCWLLRPDLLCPIPKLDWLGLAAVVAL
jgi:phosphohistidine phosphatase SixA